MGYPLVRGSFTWKYAGEGITLFNKEEVLQTRSGLSSGWSLVTLIHVQCKTERIQSGLRAAIPFPLYVVLLLIQTYKGKKVLLLLTQTVFFQFTLHIKDHSEESPQ